MVDVADARSAHSGSGAAHAALPGGTRERPPRWSLALFALILASALLIRLPGLPRLLEGSEVDYVLAARRGFLTNYLDRGTRPFSEYVTAFLVLAGVTAPSATSGGDRDPNLWRLDVDAGDIAAYRHYHPPALMYLLHAVERTFGFSETTVRLVPLLLSCSTIGLLYFGCALLLPAGGYRVGLIAAAILSMLSLHIDTSTDIGWHNPYATLATLALFAIGVLAAYPSKPALIGAAVATTLAFTLLEHALFLYGTLAVMLLARRRGGQVAPGSLTLRRALLMTAAASAITLLAVWPASLLKLSLLKNLGVHAYYSRTLRLSPSFYDVYLTLLDRYPMMSALAIATTVVLLLRRWPLPRVLLPFAVYVAAMCLLQVSNQNLKPLYFVSMLPPLAVLAAYWIVQALDWMDTRRFGLVSGVIVALACSVSVMGAQSWLRPRATPPMTALVRALASDDEIIGARALTLPADSHVAQALSFYLPETHFVRVIDEPGSRRRAAEALRRAVYEFVIVELDPAASIHVEASWPAYARQMEVVDAAGRSRYLVLRRFQ